MDYLLDAFGRRVGKKVDGTLVRGYLWSGSRLVAELDGTGAVLARFVYATRAHVPDLVVKAGTTYRILSDERGSPRLVVNASTGAIAQKLSYDVTGRVTSDTSPEFQPFGFGGGITDPDTDLVLMGQRTYDPETVRWLSRDQIGFGGGANHYAYAWGDPLNLIDPSGLSAIGCLQDLLGLAGMIPGIGAAFDVANALIYAARGKWGDAALSLAATVIPLSLSSLKGVARFGRYVDEGADVGRGFGQLDEAFHWTRSESVSSIMETGLKSGTYATPSQLTQMQAHIELALSPNAPRDVVLRIDLAGLRKAGYSIPEASRVTGRFGMPGGGWELKFPSRIPSEFIKEAPLR